MTEKQTAFELLIPDNIQGMAKEISTISNQCVDISRSAQDNMITAFAMASGVTRLRQMFDMPEIKNMVEAMANTPLGFLTDRDPNNTYNKKPPYKYQEIKECVIEGMLKGYRITNNEMNIIAGKFYPAKNGRYRLIKESPGITDFDFWTTPSQDEGNGHSKVACFATWKQDGVPQSIGMKHDDGTDERLVFRVRKNAAMGEDAVIGKALSKLFGRVLTKISGVMSPESTDIVVSEAVVKADLSHLKNGKTKEDAPAQTPSKTKILAQWQDLCDEYGQVAHDAMGKLGIKTVKTEKQISQITDMCLSLSAK